MLSCSTPSWERRFTELIEFKRSHGHCEVPQNYSENASLGTWVNKVRTSAETTFEYNMYTCRQI
jgi:hypothetical protein